MGVWMALCWFQDLQCSYAHKATLDGKSSELYKIYVRLRISSHVNFPMLRAWIADGYRFSFQYFPMLISLCLLGLGSECDVAHSKTVHVKFHTRVLMVLISLWRSEVCIPIWFPYAWLHLGQQRSENFLWRQLLHGISRDFHEKLEIAFQCSQYEWVAVGRLLSALDGQSHT